MIEFIVQTRLKGWEMGPAAFRRAARLLAPECLPGMTEGEISISFLSALKMAQINESYLGHSGPTDVITFDYSIPCSEPNRPIASRGNIPAPVSHFVAGEILICPEVAAAQGSAYGTGWKLEVLRYLAHGLLHLAGHDDQEPLARRAMKLAEDAAVKRITAELSPGWDAPARARPKRGKLQILGSSADVPLKYEPS